MIFNTSTKSPHKMELSNATEIRRKEYHAQINTHHNIVRSLSLMSYIYLRVLAWIKDLPFIVQDVITGY